MRKLVISGIALSLLLISATARPCSDIFVNQPGSHIEARTMDFGLNLAMDETFGFIGQENTTDVVIDAQKIPAKQLTRWTNKYGYWGRDAYDSAKIVDGMNTQGFSLGALYAAGFTKYAEYNPKDSRPVIGFFDLGTYLLSRAATVDEAIGLMEGLQIVQSALPLKAGVFLKNIPVHFIMRDATGNSAVVESIDGKIVINEHAGNVMTNSPSYPEHLAQVKKYDNLDIRKDLKLTGLPGGFSSTERFARASVMLRNLPKPYSNTEALYQANRVINSVTVPFFGPGKGDVGATVWRVLKDLDRKVVYEISLLYFQGGGKIAPTHVASDSYNIIDLTSIDFSHVPREFEGKTIQPTPPDRVVKILSAKDIPEFGE